MPYWVTYATLTLRLRYACATALLSLSITLRSPRRLHTTRAMSTGIDDNAGPSRGPIENRPETPASESPESPEELSPGPGPGPETVPSTRRQGPGVEDPEEARLLEELADLRRRQRLAALRKEVEEERRNLAALEGPSTGSTLLPTPTERATGRPRSETVGGEEEPPPKRQRRDDDNEEKRKLVDLKESWGKSLKEYTEFIRTCKRNFNT